MILCKMPTMKEPIGFASADFVHTGSLLPQNVDDLRSCRLAVSNNCASIPIERMVISYSHFHAANDTRPD
jgi:hypothetical protein